MADAFGEIVLTDETLAVRYMARALLGIAVGLDGMAHGGKLSDEGENLLYELRHFAECHPVVPDLSKYTFDC